MSQKNSQIKTATLFKNNPYSLSCIDDLSLKYLKITAVAIDLLIEASHICLFF
jgi:hypothetical protein